MAILAKCTKAKILLFSNLLIHKRFNRFQILAQSLH
jgi:hypothetical protein